MVATLEEAKKIEKLTQDQADNEQWIAERRKRMTASNIGCIAKMRASTKTSKKVQQLLYNSFRGNAATQYGTQMEELTRQKYQTYMKETGHSCLTVEKCGLFISIENPWLAGTPDGLVCDFADDCSQSLGLVEIKNPYSAQCMTLSEAVKKSSFCLQKSKDCDLWTSNIEKLKNFYFCSLLPELACPRHYKGGIRELVNQTSSEM